jgi:hypothetical protein
VVRVGVVARGVALRITALLSIRSFGSISSNNNNIIVTRLRVPTGVDERHLPEYKSERIMGWGERAMLRAEVNSMSRHVGRRGVGTSFRCQGDRRENNKQR